MAEKKDDTLIYLGGAALLAYLFFSSSSSGSDGGGDQAFTADGTPSVFIAETQGLAQQLLQQYGIPVDTTLAIAGDESAWGSSGIFKNTYNAFGIHGDDGEWTGQTYTPPGDPNNASFRKYNNVAESFADFGKFLTENSRYKPAFDLGTSDPVEFVQAIAAAGYSESPDYAKILIPIIQTVQKIRGQ